MLDGAPDDAETGLLEGALVGAETGLLVGLTLALKVSSYSILLFIML
jgi:hypothetical protein